MATQLPFDPQAGFVAAVPDVPPYPAFPEFAVDRWRWVLEAPIRKPRGEPPKWRPDPFGKAALGAIALHADKSGKAWPAVHTIARLASMSRREAIESIHRLEQAGWMTVQRRPRLSSVYRPKRPQDELCQGCWFVLHRDAKGCPSCGLETGVRSAHLGVQGVHPKLYRNTKGISSMKEDQNLSLLKTLSPGELNDASCDLRRPR